MNSHAVSELSPWQGAFEMDMTVPYHVTTNDLQHNNHQTKQILKESNPVKNIIKYGTKRTIIRDNNKKKINKQVSQQSNKSAILPNGTLIGVECLEIQGLKEQVKDLADRVVILKFMQEKITQQSQDKQQSATKQRLECIFPILSSPRSKGALEIEKYLKNHRSTLLNEIISVKSI